MLIGIILVLLASALNAVQNVFEEKLLKAVGGAEVDPLELVGWEGLFGSLLSMFVLLPIVYQIPGDDCGRSGARSVQAGGQRTRHRGAPAADKR